MSSSRGEARSSAAEPTSLEATRRALTARQAETVDALVTAAVDELREAGYDGLTVRNVARRAGVAPATAYTYFASKDHLVTEAYWRRLVALPETEFGPRAKAQTRVARTLSDICLLVADEPQVAAACTIALLAGEPDVAVLRARIGTEMRRRLARALADDGRRTDSGVLRALEWSLTGGLVNAGTGHVAYDDLPDLLAGIAALVLDGRNRLDGRDR